ncbi:MAG TPA: hypothetical protein PLP58_17285 [Prosthecobacter sp.]|nr:hypothetical protein [Prosthecobacter sp.]
MPGNITFNETVLNVTFNEAGGQCTHEVTDLNVSFSTGIGDSAGTLKAKLESLEGDDRLDATAIKNLPSGPGGDVEWGDIEGTLADQTDLQTALNAKAASSHTHTLADITDAGDAAALDVGTTAGTVCAGDDARLTDARAPTAHASSHVTGGADKIRDATASQDGLMTAAAMSKLNGIETAADVTDAGNVGAAIHGAAEKTTPVDGDKLGLIDSAASNVLKWLSWSNLKATLKSYLDTLYAAIGHTHAQLHDRSHAVSSTSDHTAGNWKIFHSNGSGQVIELPLGADGTFLKSNGVAAAPTFSTPSGSGDVLGPDEATANGVVLFDGTTGKLVKDGGLLGDSAFLDSSSFAAAEHTHDLADITDAGNSAGLNVGTTAGTVCAGDDARLSDARAPTAHASSHVTGGADKIRDATASQDGIMTAAAMTKLDGIEAAADVTDAGNVGAAIHGAAEKTTPADADKVPLIDSAASNVLKWLSWSNLKAALKSYFDTLYAAIGAGGTVIYSKALSAGVDVTDNAAFQVVSGLGVPVAANKTYVIKWHLSVVTSATGTGSHWGFDGPASPARVMAHAAVQNVSGTAPATGVVHAYGEIAANSAGRTTSQPVILEARVSNGSNAGTVNLTCKVETAVSGTVTTEGGSWVEYYESTTP